MVSYPIEELRIENNSILTDMVNT